MTNEIQQANSSLIAAAPDLLDLVQAFVAAVEKIDERGGDYDVAINLIMPRFKAAIAKARGE